MRASGTWLVLRLDLRHHLRGNRHAALSHAIDGPANYWDVSDVERRARIPVTVRFSCNTGHMLHDLALAGDGIALLPDWSVLVHALYRARHRNEARALARRASPRLRRGRAGIA